jgi:hypothetical protein
LLYFSNKEVNKTKIIMGEKMKNKGSDFGKHPPKGKKPEKKELTAEQKSAAQEILAKYDLKDLGKDDAKEIFKALGEIGIHGPGVFDVVKEAGADPKELFDMVMDGKKMPPPPHSGKGPRKPPKEMKA